MKITDITNTILTAAAASFALVAATPVERRELTKLTSQAQYDLLVRNTKFAGAALARGCETVNGATVVSDVKNLITDTQGYVARDDKTKEIIVALRGTSSGVDALTDAYLTFTPCTGTKIPYPGNARCHKGFLTSYNSVADQFIKVVGDQLATYPGYTVTVTGHSLGGALASFAALSMKYNFPNTKVTGYSFGQPRTGDKVYAAFHDSAFPLTNGLPTFTRAVHTSDGVTQVIRQGSTDRFLMAVLGLFLPTNNPQATSGYWHHGTEVWQFQEPAIPANTRQCNGGEDPTCQDSMRIFAPLAGINGQHLVYFGQIMTNIFCPAP